MTEWKGGSRVPALQEKGKDGRGKEKIRETIFGRSAKIVEGRKRSAKRYLGKSRDGREEAWMNIRRTETRGADKEKKLCGGSRECRAKKTAGWKKGKICEAACILWAVLLLSGCQLAREETGSRGADKLCGVLITTQNQVDAWRASQKAGPEDSAESVELTQGQMKQLLNGETEIFLDSREISGGWQVEGIPGEDGEYVFQGLEGASLMAGLYQEDENGGYTYYTANGVFQDLHYNSHTSDQGETSSSEGTIYMGEKADVTLYMNPVYQRQDGSIYVLLDSTAGYWNSGQTSPGVVYSKSIKEENTQTVVGNTQTEAREFTVHFAVGQEVRAARIKEWSREDTLLGETEVFRGLEKLRLREDTAYVVVEEEREDGTVKRSIYTWEPEKAENGELTHTFYYQNEEGLLEGEVVCFEK